MTTPVVYLDNNATTALAPAAFEAMAPWLTEEHGNPSSLHAAGVRAARAVAAARERVAALVGARASEVVFTASGTEADAMALLGALEAAGDRDHVVASAVEHPAVRDLLHALRARGRIRLDEVAPGRDGRLDADAVLARVGARTALVTVMWANNETGVLHPVDAIARGCRARGVVFHSDAVQAAGKVPLAGGDGAPDLLALAAHKFHGPKGVGVLVVRRGTRWKPALFAGHQERGRRGGTENVAGIVGTGVAAEEAARSATAVEAVAALRDAFEERVLAALPGARRTVAREGRVANTSHLLLGGVEGEAVLLQMDARGVALSSGSACTAGSLEPSHVLRALGVPEREARSAVRVSLSRHTTAAEIERAADALVEVVLSLREVMPL